MGLGTPNRASPWASFSLHLKHDEREVTAKSNLIGRKTGISASGRTAERGGDEGGTGVDIEGKRVPGELVKNKEGEKAREAFGRDRRRTAGRIRFRSMVVRGNWAAPQRKEGSERANREGCNIS